jgi:tryptophanyl-tRNA synthetase
MSAPEQKTPGPKKRVMSGTRITGNLHVGHYWGVFRNWIKLQDEYECFFGLMDWHGMTTAYKSVGDIKGWTRDMIADLIAWGLDPEKCYFYVQSQVPEILELNMIFTNLTPLGWLERVPTWKDAIEDAKQNDTYNLGRFGYPVLQAADIAIFKGSLVPVGADQVAHLELTREIIRRFNHLYKGKLPEPQPLLTDTPAVAGLDGRKMSKSYNNTILWTEPDEKSLKKKVNLMLTDPARARRENPGNPEICPVYSFHKLYSSPEDLDWSATGCRTAGIGCGDCKGRLFENMEKMTKGPREKKKELLNNPGQLDSIVQSGCEKARAEAQKTLKEVRTWMKW